MKTIRQTLTAAIVLVVLGLGAPAAYSNGGHAGAEAGKANLHCC